MTNAALARFRYCFQFQDLPSFGVYWSQFSAYHSELAGWLRGIVVIISSQLMCRTVYQSTRLIARGHRSLIMSVARWVRCCSTNGTTLLWHRHGIARGHRSLITAIVRWVRWACSCFSNCTTLLWHRQGRSFVGTDPWILLSLSDGRTSVPPTGPLSSSIIAGWLFFFPAAFPIWLLSVEVLEMLLSLLELTTYHHNT